MTLAHIAGVPFEEWAAPLAATGTGIVYGLRVVLSRLQRRLRKELPATSSSAVMASVKMPG